MKVFTVGLDQKPPLEEAKGSPEKSDTPPPGYSTTAARIPLPLGPELPRPPLPPQPIIMRKSRGYKGILLVLLAVFLMAAFALTLSEMAYNRQREENFFKLRWAELKHRMGYENAGPYDYYHRASAAIGEKFDRLFSLAKSNELPLSLPIAASMENNDPTTTTTSTTTAPAQPPEPVVAIDSFPRPMGLNGRARQPFGAQQNSAEMEQPILQMFGNNGMPSSGPFSQVRDARLQFLRNILQKIKQHAEDIGFDGTMQVSIIEVEPQNAADGAETAQENGNNNNNNNNNNIWGPQQQQQQQNQPQQQQAFPAQLAFPMPQQFFPNPRPLIDDFKNSRSFLDGFGEFHPPSFVQQQQMSTNHITEPEERPRMFGPWAQQQQQQMPNMPDEFQQQQQHQQQQQQQQNVPDFMENMRWPHINPFRQTPEMLFFRPIFPQQMNLRFPPVQPPQVHNEWAQQQQQQQQQNGAAALPRPAAFDRWNGAQQPPAASPNNGFFVPPPPPPQFTQQQQPQPQQQEQTEQPQQTQQQIVQQSSQPQQQQIQIDFPEVKLPPPPSIDSNDNSNNNNVVDDNNKNKFQLPIVPQTEQPQAQNQQNQQQPQQPRQDWLPKWSTSSSSSAADKADPDNSKDDDDDNDTDDNINSNRGTGTMFGGAGPPSAQPSDIVKFPSVTVVEAAKNEHDDAVEPVPTSLGTDQPAAPPVQPTPAAAPPQIPPLGAAAAPIQTEQQPEKKEQSADELVEVDAPPQPIVPQQNSQPPQQQQQEEMAKTGQEQPQPPQQPQQQPQLQQQPSPPGISPFQQQKWFPEVPSVFFQVDDPNGGNAGGTDDVNVPKPAELVANDGGASEQQRPRQPHMVVD